MDEDLAKGIGITILVIFVIGIFFWFISSLEKHDQELRNQISEMGYQADDVEVFLKGTDFDYDDFIKSEGLKKQYEKFLSGESANYMDNARADKKSSDAESSARTAQYLAMASLARSSSSR